MLSQAGFPRCSNSRVSGSSSLGLHRPAVPCKSTEAAGAASGAGSTSSSGTPLPAQQQQRRPPPARRREEPAALSDDTINLQRHRNSRNSTRPSSSRWPEAGQDVHQHSPPPSRMPRQQRGGGSSSSIHQQQQQRQPQPAAKHAVPRPLPWPSAQQQQQQQQLRRAAVRTASQLPPEPSYQQQLDSCRTWQQLQAVPLDGQFFQPQCFTAVAVASARLHRRLLAAAAAPGSTLAGNSNGSPGAAVAAAAVQAQRAGRHGHQQTQQQQPGDAAALWHWWNSRVLGRCIKLGYVHQQQQQQQHQKQHQQQQQQQAGVAAEASAGVDTVTAAALLHATAAMGWNVRTLTTAFNAGSSTSTSSSSSSSTDGTAAGKQLTGAVLTLLELGLAAAVGDRQQWQLSGRGGDSSSSSSSVVLRCPPAAAVNLVTAAQLLAVRLQRQRVLELRDAVLAAAFSSAASSRVGFAASMKLLHSCVAAGSALPDEVLLPLCRSLQANLLQRPELLLALLHQLSSLEQQAKQRREHSMRQQQQLQDMLLSLRRVLLAHLPGHMLQQLQQQLQDRLQAAAGTAPSSRSRVLQHSAWDGSSNQQQQQQAQSFGRDAAKEQVALTAALTQLPMQLPRSLTQPLVTQGLLLLQAANQAIRAAADSSRRSPVRPAAAAGAAVQTCCFPPVEVSSWVSNLGRLNPGGLLPRDRKTLALALLDYTGETRGQKGLWPPQRFLPLLAGACDLSLPAVAGSEFWAAVQETVLLELRQYWPVQLVSVLQCMAGAGFKPEPEVLELHLLPAISAWFSSNLQQQAQQGHAGSSRRDGRRSSSGGSKPLTVPQLVQLLQVLAELRHKPKLDSWWAGFQETLMQQTQLHRPAFGQQHQGPPPQQQQQQQGAGQQQQGAGQQQQGAGQQQPDLGVSFAVKLLWSTGRLRLTPQPAFFAWLLRQLELQPAALAQLPAGELVDLLVGLSKLVPKAPGLLEPQLYARICCLLRGKSLRAKDVGNIVRSMGTIADSTATGAVSGALVARIVAAQQERVAAGSPASSSMGGASPAGLPRSSVFQGDDDGEDQEDVAAGVPASAQLAGRQQQPLVPPEAVVMELLEVVQPQLSYLKGRGLAMLLWGVRKMGFRPTPAWLNGYQHAVMAALPSLAAYEVAIIFSCLVHLGCQLEPQILQSILAQGPRESFSAGIMGDLQAALAAVAQQQQQMPQQWQTAGSASDSRWYEPEQIQRNAPEHARRRRKQQQQQHRAEAGATISADASSDDLDDASLDILIDAARRDLGALDWWQQQQTRGGGSSSSRALGSAGSDAAGGSGADNVSSAGGGGSLADGELDAEVARRIADKLAVVEELIRDSITS